MDRKEPEKPKTQIARPVAPQSDSTVGTPTGFREKVTAFYKRRPWFITLGVIVTAVVTALGFIPGVGGIMSAIMSIVAFFVIPPYLIKVIVIERDHF